MTALRNGGERILGISFFTGTVEEAVERHVRDGGYVVIPAAPALIKLNYDEEYRRAMQGADLALADSGLLVLLLRLVTGRRLKKISGISYFTQLFEHGGLRAGETAFWIFGSNRAKEKAIEWMRRRGVEVGNQDCFVAVAPPSSTQDYAVLADVEQKKPRHVVIAMAGGNQEKLARYLRDYLLYRPAIHCIGAALGFLSGEEKAIPRWAERSDLGWLFRLFAQPRMIFPRIGIAVALARMVLKYRSELPKLKQRWADI